VTPLADRRGERADAARVVLRLMRIWGQLLIREHRQQRVRWYLSGGTGVPGDVAALVLADPHVVGNGDRLFFAAPSQTYRWCP
jgi:hypothetical protein